MIKEKLLRFNDKNNHFICPICEQALLLENTSLYCNNKHCYDISKYGYVNFILNNKKQRKYNKTSFQNRRYVLENGLYEPILQEIVKFINENKSIQTILDAGCGEGFYANQIQCRTQRNLYAFDISKDSIQLASKNDNSNSIKWFVGDLSAIPLKNNSADCILNIFSPANYKEFHRILAPDGWILKIVPTDRHLTEIRNKAKEQLRNKEYSNQQVIEYFEKAFIFTDRKKITHRFSLNEKDRQSFIEMTPLLFNVDKKAIDWSDMHELTIEAEILIGKSKN
ncbi:MAG: methyltransferase domain-containing protein [Firmicutes bacterium]|nr:methyltransferase domain-containing protein [Bacillota bacterium]